MSALDDALQTIVDDLTASLDDVTGAWTPCWSRFSTLPSNALTGQPYQGINTMVLWGAQIAKAYESPVWATYKQWVALGGQVRKGERATACIKWVEPKAKDGQDPEVQRRLVPIGFSLFNAAQQDGWVAPDRTPIAVEDAGAAFMAAMDAVPVSVIEGKPCYVPSMDLVMLPPDWSWHTAEGMCSTIAHEYAHWTGHQSRLARDLSGRFGSEAYAAEELVAEISSAFTCARFGLGVGPAREDHARYIKSWLRVLADDRSLIMVAARLAQRATNFLMEFSHVEACADPVAV